MIELLNIESFKEKVFDFEKNSEWKFEGKIPAIVKFTAEWCGPCRVMKPILKEVANEYENKINIYEVDVDEEQEIASAFGIRSIPSMIFCKGNNKPSMMTGAVSKTKLIESINKNLL